MLMKFAPASVATALASMVFPVPGGPNKSIPLQGWKMKENKIDIENLCIQMKKKRNL